MTREDITREEALKELKEYEDGVDIEYATPFDKAILYAIKTLEQEPCEDTGIRLIHTQGLDEGIRCAMCTNSMANDRGCDGSCIVNDFNERLNNYDK